MIPTIAIESLEFDSMLAPAKLESLLDRYQAIVSQLAAKPDPDVYVQLSRDYAELDPIVSSIKKLRAVESELIGVEELIADTNTDAEMREMAVSEKTNLEGSRDKLQQEIQLALLPKDVADSCSAILELRAGTGGDEAALFAGDLYRMYERYAELNKWEFEILSYSEGEMGGYKELIASVSGEGVFARLKFETGVHRVQRVPLTESSGRIHTSAATVAVLPQPQDVDIELNQADLRIDTFRSSGPGGQHANKTDSAIRITHEPTGVVVTVENERSQHKNKERAMNLIKAKIFEIEREKVVSERAEIRRHQVGSGDRSQKIRTYNFPQGRVTDHRIGLTLHKLEGILAGFGLDELVNALILDHQTALLNAEELA